MIKRESIQNLKHHVDICQLIGDYVSLQRAGSVWKGLSPFSQEKTPSFHVDPDKGLYYCFSTSQGGDAIKFLQVKENLSFTEAVEALAERFNFKLEYETREGGGAAAGTGRNLKRLRMIHEQAQHYYRQAFNAETAEGAAVRKYWVEDRGFTLEQAETYGIGYAPGDGGLFYRFLSQQRFSDAELEASGLFFPRRQAGRGSMMARFRGRLMVPICDLMGKVIAFTGRKMSQTPANDPAFEAKYVNSPGTDLFNKGTLLFGIHIARKAVNEHTPFVMVEGQLDAVRCWTEGFEQVVATQGTAITEVQLSKLKNYGPSLIMCLDGDAAGVKAALRVLPMALAAGIDIRFVHLDQGEDPDSLLREQGREAFQQLIDQATPVVPFLVDRFFDSENRDPAALSRSCQQCFEIILKSPSQVVQTGMIEELANLAGLETRSLRTDFETLRQRVRNHGNPVRKSGALAVTTGSDSKLSTVESDLLRLVIQHAPLRDRLRSADPVDMLDPASVEGRLLIRICAELREDPHWMPERDADLVCETEAEQNLLYHLLASASQDPEAEESFELCLQSLLHRFQKRRLQLIERKLSKGGRFSDEELTVLLGEKLELQRSIANQRDKR